MVGRLRKAAGNFFSTPLVFYILQICSALAKAAAVCVCVCVCDDDVCDSWMSRMTRRNGGSSSLLCMCVCVCVHTDHKKPDISEPQLCSKPEPINTAPLLNCFARSREGRG